MVWVSIPQHLLGHCGEKCLLLPLVIMALSAPKRKSEAIMEAKVPRELRVKRSYASEKLCIREAAWFKRKQVSRSCSSKAAIYLSVMVAASRTSGQPLHVSLWYTSQSDLRITGNCLAILATIGHTFGHLGLSLATFGLAHLWSTNHVRRCAGPHNYETSHNRTFLSRNHGSIVF